MNKVLEFCFKCLGFEYKLDPKKIKSGEKPTDISTYDLKASGSPKSKARPTEIDGVKVAYPYDTAEIQDALSVVKKGKPIIIDPEMMSDYKKCISYLEGAVEILDGRIKQIPDTNLFLILPKGVLLEYEEA